MWLGSTPNTPVKVNTFGLHISQRGVHVLLRPSPNQVRPDWGPVNLTRIGFDLGFVKTATPPKFQVKVDWN